MTAMARNSGFQSGSSNRNLVNEKGLLKVVLLTPRRLRELRRQHKIPFIKLGQRTVMYDVEKVLTALERFEIREVQ
jgi:hypothetical protein